MGQLERRAPGRWDREAESEVRGWKKTQATRSRQHPLSPMTLDPSSSSSPPRDASVSCPGRASLCSSQRLVPMSVFPSSGCGGWHHIHCGCPRGSRQGPVASQSRREAWGHFHFGTHWYVQEKVDMPSQDIQICDIQKPTLNK